MKGYASMSDFEINKLVAESSSFDFCVRINFSGDTIGGGAEKWICRNEWLTKFDPCNNPADSWPIITANRIGIIPSPERGAWRAANRVIGADSNPRYFTQDANPLRAAMIVFLKMQEAK